MRPASSYFNSALQFYKTVAVIVLSHKLLIMLAVCPRWTLFKRELWAELVHPQGELGRNLVRGGCQGGPSQDMMMQALRRMTSVRASSKQSMKRSSDLSRDSSFRQNLDLGGKTTITQGHVVLLINHRDREVVHLPVTWQIKDLLVDS